MKKKQQKNSKKKRVLAVSILLAALIIAGGTFAWFTSKDEVTNKLSAKNDYQVLITETFEVPTQWTPGVEVEKDVAVVNTGSVDAFVRLSLENNVIDVTTLTTSTTLDETNGVILSTAEATALQAGNQLVYGTVKDDGTLEDGLVVYLRSEKNTNDLGDSDDGTLVDKEYVGYYQSTSTVDNKSTTTYYEVKILKSVSNTTNYQSITTSDGTILYYAYVIKNTASESKTMTLNYEEMSSTKTGDEYTAGGYIVATYNVGTDSIPNYITININLVKGWEEYWYYNSADNYFYYKGIVESGKETNKLVDSVTLDSDVKQDAYYSFDYYLTVALDSVQATEGTSKTTAVNDANWGIYATVDSNGKVTWGSTNPDATAN